MGALTLVTAAVTEPVSVDDQKSWSRIDIADDDTLIGLMLEAAKKKIQNWTSRKLITQTWKWTFDAFPACDTLEIPLAPTTAVTHVKYTDADGDITTFPASSYKTDFLSEPARIRLASGFSWPSVTLKEVNAIEIQIVVGYADAGAVPEEILTAIKFLTAYWYENREMYSTLRLKELNDTVVALIDDYAAWNRFGSIPLEPSER